MAPTRPALAALALALALLPSALAGPDRDRDRDQDQDRDREYLREAQGHCRADGGLVSCAKYKTALALHRLAGSRRAVHVGPLRLVSVNASSASDADDPFPSGRSAPGETGLVRLFRFGVRQLRAFVASHGISVPVGQGAQLVADDGTAAVADESRSRNLHVIVPLMIMVKLMSISGMLIPTLLGVAALKKALILTVMLLPSFLHKLKACKVIPHLVHYTPHHTHSHEYHDDYAAPHQWSQHRRTGHYRR